MPTGVDLQALVAAAEKVVTTFDSIPSHPVAVNDTAHIDHEAASEIVLRYVQNGFCVLELVADKPTPYNLRAIASSLHLGDPFIPPLYTMGANKVQPVSRISAARNASTPDAHHPSFGRTVGQNLHSDGTLQDIGFVKAAILLCECAAAEGGDTTLFNTSAAYNEIITADPAAAAALATPGTLIRKANINGCTDENSGPVVSVKDGQLVCRYSVTETDSWAVPDGVDEDDLRRGIEFMADAARPGSRHYAELKLAAGQAIIFDNTRISHGRTAYLDSDVQRRCMFRGLYLRDPAVTSPEPDRPQAPPVTHGYLSSNTVIHVPVRLKHHAANPLEAQVVSLLERHDREQPSSSGSPTPPVLGTVDLAIPLASELLDELFAARLAPVEVDGLVDRLGLTEAQSAGFRRMFTEQPPRSYEPNLTEHVWMRRFGHASILLDFGGFTVMTDPVVGRGDCFGRPYSVVDLPETIDVVVLTRDHPDHFSLETLLQLRRRVGVIVVLRAPGRLRVTLEHLGFTDVVEIANKQMIELGPVRITTLPAGDEDGERGTRIMMVPLVRLGGRAFLFATGTSSLTSEAHDLVLQEASRADVAFIGTEHSVAERFWSLRDEDM